MVTTIDNSVHEKLSKHILADGYDFVMDLEKSHGSWIVDQRNGDVYLDMFSMYASGSVGYNHPYIVKHKDWLGTMAINKPAMSDVYSKEFSDFVETFGRIAIPPYLRYAFFICGGALGVENALKAGFDWKSKINFNKGIKVEASKVIHFKQAFHGRSGYTLSLTNTKDPRKTALFPKFDWPRIENPKLKFPKTEENLKETIELEKIAIQQIKNAIAKNPHEIACLIIEPIQAEGGDNHFRKEFLQELRTICDENDIFFVMDEVQTGVGLTGKMWAHQHFDIIPDAIAFGKKTQVCGFLANPEKLDIIDDHVFKESSRINSTFGGNFIDMMRFKLILEIIENENLIENARVNGDYLLQQIQELALEFPDKVSNPRGLGLMCAFDLPSDEERVGLIKKLHHQEKMIILGCGEQSIRFRPHLTVTKEEIDEAIHRIKKCLV